MPRFPDHSHHQTLLELALSLSSETDLPSLLETCLSLFLRKLQCTVAAVIQDAPPGPQPVLILPAQLQDTFPWRPLMAHAQPSLPGTEAPAVVFEADTCFMIFPLPEFGILILERATVFEPRLLQEIAPIINNLAKACLRCHAEALRNIRQQQLSALHATQETLLNSLPFMAWMKDREGRYVIVNKTFAARFGLQPAAVLGKTAHDIWPEKQAKALAAADAEILRTGHPHEGLDRERGDNDSSRWFEFSRHPIRTADGQIIGSTGVRWEVTDRILAEQALAKRTAFQKVVMELAVGFVNTPLQELDQGINNALAMVGEFSGVDRVYIFHYDFSAQIMTNTYEWCAPGITPEKDNLQAVPNAMLPDWILAHSRGDLLHIPCVTDYPPEAPVRQILEPQGIQTLITLPLLHAGHCFGFVGFDAVRTQKHWSEHEIALLKVTAVLLTNAEIRRLHEQHLLAATVSAEAASLAKSEFLANMSHEIRTPLHGIVGMIDLLKGTRLDQEQREFLEMAASSTESLLSVINDILDFSKIEAGKLELTPRLFDLEEELYRLASIVSVKAREKGLELLVRYDPAAPRLVFADNLRLRQILSNLLFNATKFTSQGHILLDMQCLHCDAQQVHLEFSVEDTGIGIAKDKYELIFEQFAQVDGSSSRKYGGTGLGLAICQQLVRIMGGCISVQSVVDQGSRFSFELHLPWSPPPTAESESIFSLQGYRALIVDDMAINRRILSEYLNAWGVQHDTANSALGALRLLNHAADDVQSYDFMLLDHAMPGVDGLEMAKILHANKRLSSPRIILMTSMWGMLNAEEAAAMDIWAMLPKPVSASDLFNTIRDCLQGHRRQADQASEQVSAPAPHDPKDQRVLVVDDHPINRKTASVALEKLGYQVCAAENGLEALELVREEHFDLIFMDVQMPIMDGFETCQAIRGMGGRFETLPIIALTANAMENDRERCLAAGMSDYLPKPMPKDKLLAILKQYEPLPQETAPPGKPLEDFHHADFLARYDLDTALAREILNDFLDDGPDSVQQIRQSIAQRDSSAEALAHRFKGPCAYVGAERLHDLCAQLMSASQQAHWPQADMLAQTLEKAWGRFVHAAQAWLHTLAEDDGSGM